VFAWDRNTTPERRAAFVQQILDRMRSDARVQEVGAVSAMPFIEANISIRTLIRADGATEGDALNAFFTVAAPGYFSTLHIPLRRGRALDEGDRAGGRAVAVISESLARRVWADADPVGRQISFRFQGRVRQAEVVGVVADLRHDALDRPSRAEIFVPHAQYPYGSMTFVARTNGNPAGAISALKAHIHAVDPLQAIYRVATAEELVSNSLVERRLMLTLLAGFALLAGLLAAVGIYGVVSVATARRTREIGVRVALGATRREILAMVMRQGASMAAVGLGIGLTGALVFGGVMSHFLFELQPNDPLTLAAAITMLAVVALTACALPARRATRVDPLVALRAE
jgi:predicted permease